MPESWEWPIGVSLSLEAGYQRRTFSVDTWTLEVRPIVDQRSLKGENAGRGLAFTPAAKVSYEVTARFAAGLEYYGDIGPIDRIDRPRDQQHLIFPVLDVDLGPRWELNLGVGAGLTPGSDRLIVKMILGYRFGPLPTH